MSAMLELKGITRRYGEDTVLDDVSLSVDEGSTLVLFGPSGAGKTVMLRLIAGVIDADAGDVWIDGQDMHGVEPEARGVGMAFQNFALFPHMKAFDNIASPLLARRSSKEAMRERVGQVARLLKIDHVLEQAPAALSNGQKQRTSLARALAGEPRLMLLDDPLRNVDAKLRFEMRLELPRLLRNLGTTVVYVTQDYKEAMALGDQIAVLMDGGIAQLGTPEEIYLDPATVSIASLFGDPSINLLEVVPERDSQGLFVQLSGIRMGLNEGYCAAEGQACLLGVRPEHIVLASGNSADALPVTVEAETPLNEKVVDLMSTAGGREILMSRPAEMPGPAAATAHIQIPAASALLFDAASGQRRRLEVSA